MSPAPRASTAFAMDTNSGALMASTGRPPIAGKTSASSLRKTYATWLSERVDFQCDHHSRATASKVFSTAAVFADFSAFRSAIGSTPRARSRLASSRRPRASARLMAG